MVRQGYKQTEVGTIPVDWQVSTMESITSLMTNGFVGTIKSEYVPSGTGVLYLQGFNIKENGFDLTGVTYVSDSFHKKHLKSELKENDLLTVQTGDIGVTSCLPKRFEGANCQALIISRFYDKYDSRFWSYYFNSIGRKTLKLIETGTTMKHINVGDMKGILVPVPKTKDEQKRIAEALSDVDSMISSLEKLIAKKKAIKQGTMQELLTRKKRLASFDDNWETLSLAEIGAITGSGVDKKILPDEQPITLLNYTNVYHQVSISRKDLNHQVTASAEKIKNCSVLRGDVFLTPTSETPEEIAISSVASEDMLDVVYSYHVVRLRPNTCYNGAFINYALSTPMFREQAVQFAEGSGIRYVITLKKFKEMQLYIPTDKAEQDAIVSILSDMDNEIDSLEQKLAKTRQIKHGMMQQLLTGKIRLV